MEPNLFLLLADKYVQGTATEPEKDLVEAYYAILSEADTDEITREMLDRVEKKLFEGVRGAIHTQAPVHRIHFLRKGWVRYAAAAVLLFAVAGTGYLLFLREPKNGLSAYKGDVAPGREGAKLKLSNGRIIMIDSLKDGLIAMDGEVKILKKNGQIIYEGTTDAIAYNEIIADKGRQSTAVLPDGSTVWLNAASSVRYPLHFTGKKRLVEMTGEVSFKVVHNAAMPFQVSVKNQMVEDIGTEFNINAYEDEPVVRTTLIEGSASVAFGKSKVILKAGDEAVENNGEIKTGIADINKAIAWRKGMFSYAHAGIPEIMRQLVRWYNVEVKYESSVPKDETFSGDIGQSLTLAQVLHILEKTHVKFKIEEEKRIVILP